MARVGGLSRVYDIDGVEWPSVTTILSTLGKGDALLHWAVGLAISYIRENRGKYDNVEDLFTAASANWKTMRDQAMDAGSEAHQLIEAHVKGLPSKPDVSQEARNAFFAFIQWERENKVQWLESEMKVVCREYGYAGTLDAIALIDGKRYVVDFKSSAKIYNEHSMQIAAYRYAAEQMGKQTDGCGILRLDKKTGIPEWKDCTDKYDRHLEAFINLTRCFYRLADRRLKNNPFTKEMENAQPVRD